MEILYENNKSRGNLLAGLIRRLMLSWFAVVCLVYMINPIDLTGVAGLEEISLPLVIAAVGAIFGILCLIPGRLLTERMQRYLMVLFCGVLMACALWTSFTWPFLAACLLVSAALIVYALRGWNGEKRSLAAFEEKWGYAWAAGAAALVFFLLVSLWTVCRVRSFSTPTYDFGIFAQMFHSMKTTGLPVTTVERDGALSHFAVHVSPIYYLLLPFYCLVPRPETLQVLQAAVLAIAVIPLWKLGKRHGLKPEFRFMLCLLLLLYPAYAGGTGYDIHENAFLTLLILWLFWAVDSHRGGQTAIAAMLTLMVKEDAAVYVAVLALWLLVKSAVRREGKWGLVAGGCLLAGALAWFGVVTGYLSQSGDGVMTYRYKNFIYDGSGSLLTVVKTVLMCPMKAVFECVDPEKLQFMGLTLGPLLALPLITRRYERYILLIPYLLVNLMSDYQYQHSIFFQYTFGATAFLMYLTLVNLADFRIEWRRGAALAAAVCIAAGCFAVQVMPRIVQYPKKCIQYDAYYDRLREVLDVVPDGASVAATTYYTTYLSGRDILYDVRYASRAHLLACEYIVLNVNDEKSFKAYGGYESLIAMLAEEGYELTAGYEGKLAIYHK